MCLNAKGWFLLTTMDRLRVVLSNRISLLHSAHGVSMQISFPFNMSFRIAIPHGVSLQLKPHSHFLNGKMS